MIKHLDTKIQEVVVIFIEDTMPIDPVSLEIYKSKAKDLFPGSPVVCVETKNNKDGETSYHYLKEKEGYIVTRYLYDPNIFRNFKEKNLCHELWHKCSKPTIEEIRQEAKKMKLQEFTSEKERKSS